MNPRRKHLLPQGPFLSNITHMKVRFSDIDAMGVVWHGNYARFFEEGREDLGQKYGIGFEKFKEAGLYVPVIHFCNEFHDSLRYNQDIELETRLFFHDRAILETTSLLRRAGQEQLVAFGHTIQLFTDLNGQAQLTKPQILRDFYSRYRENFHDDEGTNLEFAN